MARLGMLSCGASPLTSRHPNPLFSNLALCVNAAFAYVKIVDKTREGKVFIILEKRLAQVRPCSGLI